MSIEITSTVNTLEKGRAGGMPAGQSSRAVVEGKIVDEANGISPGLIVVASTANPERSVSLPSKPAADADALVTQDLALGSSSEEEYSGTGFTGTYTAGEILNPPRKVTITQDSDANWDATNATVEGKYKGQFISETVALDDAGNATKTTNAWFDQVDKVTIPAQTGNAPGTIGFAEATENTPLEAVGLMLMDDKLTMSFSNGVANAVSDYADEDSGSVLRRGRGFVESEADATAGDPVYVRVVAGASENLGAVRPTPDSTDCLLLEGWKFRTDSGGTNKLAEIERL